MYWAGPWLWAWLPLNRRCLLWRSSERSISHYPCAWRSWADDNCHAPVQHSWLCQTCIRLPLTYNVRYTKILRYHGFLNMFVVLDVDSLLQLNVFPWVWTLASIDTPLSYKLGKLEMYVGLTYLYREPWRYSVQGSKNTGLIVTGATSLGVCSSSIGSFFDFS